MAALHTRPDRDRRQVHGAIQAAVLFVGVLLVVCTDTHRLRIACAFLALAAIVVALGYGVWRFGRWAVGEIRYELRGRR